MLTKKEMVDAAIAKIDSDPFFTITEEYLLWVIETYGEGQEVMNTNCNGVPVKSGDYVFNHGTAGGLLRKVREGKKNQMGIRKQIVDAPLLAGVE